MDTLCIPINPLSLKLAQIDKMASIYKGAISSLVLDAELMAMALDAGLVSLCAHDNHEHAEGERGVEELGSEEIAVKAPRLNAGSRARLACSVWMSRSWCLQEGELPLSIAVQFLDGAMLLGRRSTEIGKYDEWSTSKDFPRPEHSRNSSQSNVSAGREVEAITFETFSSHQNSEQNTCPASLACECVDIALERAF